MSDEPPAAATTPDYTGRVRSNGDGRSISGWLVDRLGARIHFVGVRDKLGGGYLLTGNVVIPEYLQVDAIDGEKP